MIKETGESFGDESHIIYVNSQIKDETALGKLMHDFSCTSAKDMFYEVLADRVHYFKEDEKGVAVMCKAMEDIGAFDDEPATVTMMDKYLEENGYVNDFTGERRHHEIYLSDPRKVAPEKCKTVIRHPIKKV